MPGIVGLVTKMPREQAEPQLLGMVEALRHESFYSTGTWMEESLGLYVGWVARRNSFSDGMPLYTERRDVVLIFSGEEFPEAGSVQHLRERGHEFSPDGPQYLVHMSEEDPCFPARLNGRFHGFLVDRNAGTATLFNDRYGMHRLYYHESKEAFYFSAEAKAILSLRPELRGLEPRGLGELLACGCVLEDRTLFEGIRALPSASAWIFRNGAIAKKRTYFQSREWEEQASVEPEVYYRELREVFSRSLLRYFNGHEQIGMSVTGGLDTRMILAWQKRPPGSLPCYTFGGMFRESRDVSVGRRVARVCAQPYEVIPLGEDFLSCFPHYAARTVYLTEGSVEVSHSPDLYVNEKAREIAPVRVTGNYGGEILRRVQALKPMELPSGLFNPVVVSDARRAMDNYAELSQGHPLSFAVFRQTPWYHYGLRALEETQVSVRTPFLDNDVVRTAFRAPESAMARDGVCKRLVEDGNRALSRMWSNRGPLDSSWGRPSTVAFRGLFELLRKAEYAYDYGMPQWLAGIDRLLSPLHLEQLVLGRQKFYHFRIWYRKVLATYLREMLLDPRALARPYLERRQLEAMLQRHFQGHRNYTTAIHKVLTLELVQRLLLEEQSHHATSRPR